MRQRLTDEQRAAVRAYNLAKRECLRSDLGSLPMILLMRLLKTLTDKKEYYYCTMTLSRKHKDLQNEWQNLVNR